MGMNSKDKRILKAKIARIQGWHCYYCHKDLFPQTATLDHVEPVSKGGGTNKYNCVLACVECNREKGNLNVKEFVKKRRKAKIKSPG